MLQAIKKSIARNGAARWVFANSYTPRYIAAKVKNSVSYSQAGEDLWVWQMLGKVSYFIDIGAHDGISYSNTALFALKGSRGVCLEPVRDSYLRLASFYRFNCGVICRNFGISTRSGVYTMRVAGGLSYLPETEDKKHSSRFHVLGCACPEQRVELRTFEEAIAGINVPSSIDLLSIDVEGHERNVLSSIPFDRYAFRAIILETHLFDVENAIYLWRHRDLAQMEALLRRYGYLPAHETWTNTIYLNSRSCPPSKHPRQ